MENKTIHLICLFSEVLSDEWVILRRFFHPGILQDKNQAVLSCTDVDMSNPFFLISTAKDFSGGSPCKLYIPYSVVQMVMEIYNEDIQIGFLASPADSGSSHQTNQP
jgi:hypothetical protein